jgi:hypothetical protein
MRTIFVTLAALFLLGAAKPALPDEIARQLPRGYAVLTWERAAFGSPAHDFYIVALGREGDAIASEAYPRPLLIFERRPGGYRLAGRNDHVILLAREGGQCDPFDPSSIAVKGPWFTVENGVACGNHWTDFITFRFDAGLGAYVFDNQRNQSWEFNPDERPTAQVLITDGLHVKRAVSGHPVRFADWRDPDVDAMRAM